MWGGSDFQCDSTYIKSETEEGSRALTCGTAGSLSVFMGCLVIVFHHWFDGCQFFNVLFGKEQPAWKVCFPKERSALLSVFTM